MSAIVHQILLQSDQHFGKRLPPHHLGFLLAEIPVAVQQSIAMALRRRSSTRGRHPSWLYRAADIRFVDHDGNGETVLYFEAPTLGDSAPEIYRQTELWDSPRPDEHDTGFDLLGDVLSEMAADNADSEQFDASLLRRLLRFKRVFGGPFTEIDLTSRRFEPASPAKMSPATLQTAEKLSGRTPAAHRVRIAGTLDMIRVSTQSFGLRLDTGDEVKGVLPEGRIEDVKQLLNRRVLVLGKAVFRASSRLLRVDADSIETGENEPALWSRMPQPRSGKIDLNRLQKPQGPRSGMAAILGKWPGDETDAEVSAALERLS